MTQRNNILEELSELKSTLATMTVQNVYSVPEGYFESLVEVILNRIKATEAENAVEELGYLSPLLSNISKQIPYTVPVGYFEGLEGKLMQSILESTDYLQKESSGQTAKEELEVLSPLLSSLKKEMSARPGHSDGPYTAPHGYFENLAETITTKEKKPAGFNNPFAEQLANWKK